MTKVKIFQFNVPTTSSITTDRIDKELNDFTKYVDVIDIVTTSSYVTQPYGNYVLLHYTIMYKDLDVLTEYSSTVEDIKQVFEATKNDFDVDELTKEKLELLLDIVLDYDYSDYNDFIHHALQQELK